MMSRKILKRIYSIVQLKKKIATNLLVYPQLGKD